RDTTPPLLTLTENPAQLWSPNHRLVPIQITWQASDVCGAAPTVALSSATSSEPDDAPGDGDGRTTQDISGADLGTPDTVVSLRSERSATGTGRTYELTYEATDSSGNNTRRAVAVLVPHDTAL